MLGLYSVFSAVSIFIRIIEWAILVYCVLSWLQPRFKAFYLLRQFILPFVSPFQRLSLKVMRWFNAPIDLTCFFAVIAYNLINRLWWRLYYLLLFRMR